MQLKKKVIESKLETSVKRDFMEYINSGDESAMDTLRQLIFDLLTAEEAIKTAAHCKDIENWVNTVVDTLQPSIKGYTKEQIDLALALILREKADEDVNYTEIYCKFTELYKKNGGVY